ncbi:hypothetical protein CDL60_24545 [Roseateles noduli]|nr:hypothetical protein CDL60_24545 [Roseateles noduli]
MHARAFLVPPAAITRQSGFSLIEVTMALALLGAMSLGLLQVQQFQQIVEGGRQAGLRLAKLRDGAEQYVRDHGAALMALPAFTACEKVALAQGSQGLQAGAQPVTGCELKINGRTVQNAFQPSIQELRDLDYVAFDDSLPFPHGDTVIDGRTGQPAAARWAISVRCKANCSTAAGTGSATPTLQVLLFNTQPFFATTDLPFGYGAQLKAALQALGPDAMASLPGESAQTAAQLRGKGQTPVDNPLQAGAGIGVPGVLASHQLVFLDGGGTAGVPCGVPSPAHGASGPSGAARPGATGATCRDGSAKPTARWDFNGQDLVNVGHLGVEGEANVAKTLTAREAIHANGGLFVRHPSNGTVTRQLHNGGTVTQTLPVVDVEGHAVVRKKLIVGAGVHDYSFQANETDGMLLNGSLAIRGGFVDVSSLQRGGTLFDPRLDGIRIPHRAPGQACNQQSNDPRVSGGNIALHQNPQAPDQVGIMVCGGNGVWVKAS